MQRRGRHATNLSKEPHAGVPMVRTCGNPRRRSARLHADSSPKEPETPPGQNGVPPADKPPVGENPFQNPEVAGPAELEHEEQHSDLQLANDVRTALREDKTLPRSARYVGATAFDGIVTLRGTVRSLSEHNRVVEIAKALAGQNNVRDELEIRTSSRADH